ncbi:MAG: hypothetical protein ACP5N1_06830 [Candidatus Woesearchaeota archaeon]
MAKNKENVKDCCSTDCCDTNCCKNHGAFVGISAVLGGILTIITVLFLIFANNNLEYLLGIAWGFVILGVFMGLFALLAIKNKKE